MKPIRAAGAVIILTFMVFVGACGSTHSCAGASTVEVVSSAYVSPLAAMVERGGGGSSGGSGSSSGARSSYSGSSSGRGTGGSSGASGSKIGSSSSGRGTGSSAGGSGSRAIPVTGTGSRSTTYRTPSGGYSTVVIPTHVGSTYSYHGHSYSYHPESYWMHLGAPDPYNPYDQRNYSNPFSPYYHYHLAVSGC